MFGMVNIDEYVFCGVCYDVVVYVCYLLCVDVLIVFDVLFDMVG